MKKLNSFFGMRSFLTLWAGQSISSLGTAMTNFALMIWAYEQQGTASSVAFLSVFTYLPSILFCFVAGTLADKWDKKKIMLTSDLIAALGTVTVFMLHSTGSLRIAHLYIVNFVLSFMNAFQSPASYVAITLITPKEHYVRANGLYALSGSIVTILTPALGAAVLAFAGIRAVFIIDLVSFALGFFSLLFFIQIPSIEGKADEVKESFLRSCMMGLNFLREHAAILRIILFFSFINLLAFMGGGGMVSVMVLSRTGGDQAALGAVSTAIGVGTLIGSVLVTMAKPAKSRTRVIFLSCALSFFLCDVFLSIGRSIPIWVIAAFAGNLPLPFLNGNLSALMRTNVPVEMQGRVFSARDTLQYSTIPLGYFLGGILTDHVFEPFMQTLSPIQQALSGIVGAGRGSGIAVIFLITGIVGSLSSLLALRDPMYKELD